MKIKNPFFKIMFLIFLFLSLYIIKDYITLLISCLIMSFIIKPIYKLIKNVFKEETVSALISELLIFIFIGYIVILATNSIYYQIINFGSPLVNKFINLNDTLLFFNSSSSFVADFTQGVNTQTFDILLGKITNFLISTPVLFIHIFLFFFITHYLVIGSSKFYEKIMRLIPENSKKSIESIFLKIGNLIKELSSGYFLVSLFVILFTFIFLNFLQIPFAFDYSLISGLLSLIPLLGNLIVPLFLAIYYFYQNNLIKGVLLILFALALSYVIKMIRIIVNKKRSIHPILFIIGVIVGFYSFGILGFIIGPVIFGILQIGFNEIIKR